MAGATCGTGLRSWRWRRSGKFQAQTPIRATHVPDVQVLEISHRDQSEAPATPERSAKAGGMTLPLGSADRDVPQAWPTAALDHPVYPIELTTLEVVWLSDHLSGGDTDDGDPDRPNVQELIGRRFLERIGSLFLELVPDDLSKLTSLDVKTARLAINITQREAWLVRDRVKTGDLGYDNITNVGIPLLKKLYGVLLQCAEVAGIETSDVDRTLSDDKRAALKTLMEENDASPETH